MLLYMLLIVFMSALWVWFDAAFARDRNAPRRRDSSFLDDLNTLFDLRPLGWFLAVLLLWILAFPLYLANRNEIKRLVDEKNGIPSRGRRRARR